MISVFHFPGKRGITFVLLAFLSAGFNASASEKEDVKTLVEKSGISPMPDFIMKRSEREKVIHGLTASGKPDNASKPKFVKRKFWHRLDGIVKDQAGRMFFIVDGKENGVAGFAKKYGRILTYGEDWVRASLKGNGIKVVYVGDKFPIVKKIVLPDVK